SVKEHEEEMAEQKGEEADTKEVVSDATVQAIMQVPIALLGAAFTAPSGATTTLKLAQVLGRNLPLFLLLVMIGALFWPTDEPAEAVADDQGRPNGRTPVGTYHQP